MNLPIRIQNIEWKETDDEYSAFYNSITIRIKTFKLLKKIIHENEKRFTSPISKIIIKLMLEDLDNKIFELEKLID